MNQEIALRLMEHEFFLFILIDKLGYIWFVGLRTWVFLGKKLYIT